MKLEKKFILTGVTMIDGTGKDPVPDQALTVVDGKIAKIEAASAVEPKGGFQVVDMKGSFIMPGMIDAHVHLCGAIRFDLTMLSQNLITSAYRGLVQTQTVLKYGFTSVRDLSRSGLYLKRVLTEGTLLGPRIVAVGPGLSPTGGAIDVAGVPPELGYAIASGNNWGMIADSDGELRKAVRLLLREGADQIKFFANGADGSPIDRNDVQNFPFEQMKLIVEEAKRVPGTKVMAHVIDNKTAWDCFNAGVDTFEHIGFLDEKLCDGFVEKGKFLVPTALLIATFLDDFNEITDEREEIKMLSGGLPPFYQRDIYKGLEYTPEMVREFTIHQFQMAHQKGVKMAVGSDCIDESRTPYGEYAVREMAAMVEFGMTPLEAIRAATQVGSEVLGLEEFVGTLEVGKFADMLVLGYDPTKNINNLLDPTKTDMVILNGDVVAEKGKLNHPL